MERNSVIVERLEKSMSDRLPRTKKCNEIVVKLKELEQEFLKLIEGDQQLVEKYLEIESTMNASNCEYESMCFCEGVRLGFKLCMDIFEI